SPGSRCWRTWRSAPRAGAARSGACVPSSTACSRSSRASPSGAASWRGRSPAASSRCSPSAARWWRGRGSCCSTSRRSDWRRSACAPSSKPSPRSTAAAPPFCSWSRTRRWPSASRIAGTCWRRGPPCSTIAASACSSTSACAAPTSGPDVTGACVGRPIRRVEDPRLLRGRGHYLADVAVPHALAVAFVRSPHAHALVRAVDAGDVARVPGARAFTADDLRGVRPLVAHLDRPGFVRTEWPALAGPRVRYGGEAVAAVVAPDAYAAADACERVRVTYEPLPVPSLAEALARGDLLFRQAYRRGDPEAAFARAAVVVEETFTHARCAPSPLETRGVAAAWDG